MKRLKNKILPSYQKKKFFTEFKNMIVSPNQNRSKQPRHNFLKSIKTKTSQNNLRSSQNQQKRSQNSFKMNNKNIKMLRKSLLSNFKKKKRNTFYGKQISNKRTEKRTVGRRSGLSKQRSLSRVGGSLRPEKEKLVWRSTNKRSQNLDNCFSTYRYMGDVYLR